MSTYLMAETAADAWTKIMEHLLRQENGKSFHVVTTIANPIIEVREVTKIVDKLATEAGTMSTMENSNAIWPYVLARPGLGFDETMKRIKSLGVPIIKAANSKHQDSYMERLVAWRSKNGGDKVPQLENVIARMRSEATHHAPKTSAYEIAIFSPGLDAGYMGFPCLSHLSFKLDAEAKKIHLTALYRNHHFVTHGYGNFLGLGQLMKFVARQVSFAVGELLSISTHADAELSLGRALIAKRVEEAKRILAEVNNRKSTKAQMEDHERVTLAAEPKQAKTL